MVYGAVGVSLVVDVPSMWMLPQHEHVSTCVRSEVRVDAEMSGIRHGPAYIWWLIRLPP